MPALRWAGRSWPVADDDFVAFGLMGALVRVLYLFYLAFVARQVHLDGEAGDSNVECLHSIFVFVSAAAGLAVALLIATLALAASSGSGQLWQPHQRRAVGPLLTLELVLIACEAALLSVGLVMNRELFGACVGRDERGRAHSELKSALVVWLVLIAGLTPGLILAAWLSATRSNSSMVPREEWWRHRLAAMCCCFVGRGADDVYSSLGMLLGDLLEAHGAQHAVLSDLLTALLLVRDRQQRLPNLGHAAAAPDASHACAREAGSEHGGDGAEAHAAAGADAEGGETSEHGSLSLATVAAQVWADAADVPGTPEEAAVSELEAALVISSHAERVSFARAAALSAAPADGSAGRAVATGQAAQIRWQALNSALNNSLPSLRRERSARRRKMARRSAWRPYTYAATRLLDLADASERDMLDDAAHFIRFALAAYGWVMALWIGHERAARAVLCPQCARGAPPAPGAAEGCCACCFAPAARARAPSTPRRRDTKATAYETIFSEVAGVAAGDMLAADWARRGRPMGACAYAVCVDRERRAVVIAVRGTMDAADILTDAYCEPVDAGDVREALLGAECPSADMPAAAAEPSAGRAARAAGSGAAAAVGAAAAAPAAEAGSAQWTSHKGILDATTELLAELESSRILDTLRRQLHPSTGLLRGFELVVTGHSLGAGVATLLSVLLRARGFPDTRCLAFSPPPLLPRDAAAALAPHVLTVVLEGDVVPRLSIASVDALSAQMVAEMRACEAPKWLVWLRAFAQGARRACLGSGGRRTPLGAPPPWASDRAAARGGGAARAESDGFNRLTDNDGPVPTAAAWAPAAEEAALPRRAPLFIAGRIMLLESVGRDRATYSRLLCCAAAAVRYRALWVSADEFLELKVAHNLVDHLPDKMATVLHELRAGDAGTGFGLPRREHTHSHSSSAPD